MSYLLQSSLAARILLFLTSLNFLIGTEEQILPDTASTKLLPHETEFVQYTVSG